MFPLAVRNDGAQSHKYEGNTTVKSNNRVGAAFACVRFRKSFKSLFTAASITSLLFAPVDRAAMAGVTGACDVRYALVEGRGSVRRRCCDEAT